MKANRQLRIATAFRLSPEADAALREMSRASGIDKTELVEMFIMEGKPLIERKLRERLEAITRVGPGKVRDRVDEAATAVLKAAVRKERTPV